MSSNPTHTGGLTLFTWGYHGWGGGPAKFVAAADAVEQARGFGPPRFVDLRFSRSVRAEGFREKAFEKLLGPDRYRWYRGLGNEKIAERGLQIANPEDAAKLLDEAEAAARDGRRLLAFCSCLWPGHHDDLGCHRVLVADLLLSEAQRRGTALAVVEWPGSDPVELEIEAPSQKVLDRLADDGDLPLPAALDPHVAAGFGWGSILRVTGSARRSVLIVGPAFFRAGKWALRNFGGVHVDPTAEELAKLQHECLQRRGLVLRRTAPEDPAARRESPAVAVPSRAARRSSRTRSSGTLAGAKVYDIDSYVDARVAVARLREAAPKVREWHELRLKALHAAFFEGTPAAFSEGTPAAAVASSEPALDPLLASVVDHAAALRGLSADRLECPPELEELVKPELARIADLTQNTEREYRALARKLLLRMRPELEAVLITSQELAGLGFDDSSEPDQAE